MPKVVDIDGATTELAAAAAQLIARSGVGAATLREVAAEAGWTTGALTHYFADKRELLLLHLPSSLAERHAAHAASGDRTPPPAADWTRSRARCRWTTTGAATGWSPSPSAPRPSATTSCPRSSATPTAPSEFRVAHLAGGLRCGLPPEDAEALAERLIAAADGISVQALFDPEGWPPAHQLATLQAATAPLLTTSGN